tara:strand:- start:41 stop:190 length:150 start_codon:yes stop_codon:yes gene_type:complete
VGRLAVKHALARELLAALVTGQIAVGSVFDDSFYEALDQPAGASLAVFV